MSEETHLHRRRSRRQGSPFPRLLKTYWIELVIIAGFLLAIFLFFERLNIRLTLLAWLSRVDDAVMAFINWVIDALIRSRAGLGLSELIAIPLFLIVLAATIWRVRWRLRRLPALVSLSCPVCGGRIHRVHRHGVDHLIEYFPLDVGHKLAGCRYLRH
jgi:hypothetical protein